MRQIRVRSARSRSLVASAHGARRAAGVRRGLILSCVAVSDLFSVAMGTVWLVGWWCLPASERAACSFAAAASGFHEYSLLVARAKVTTSTGAIRRPFLIGDIDFLTSGRQHTLHCSHPAHSLAPRSPRRLANRPRPKAKKRHSRVFKRQIHERMNLQTEDTTDKLTF
jgi:hypothetical protein